MVRTLSQHGHLAVSAHLDHGGRLVYCERQARCEADDGEIVTHCRLEGLERQRTRYGEARGSRTDDGSAGTLLSSVCEVSRPGRAAPRPEYRVLPGPKRSGAPASA